MTRAAARRLGLRARLPLLHWLAIVGVAVMFVGKLVVPRTESGYSPLLDGVLEDVVLVALSAACWVSVRRRRVNRVAWGLIALGPTLWSIGEIYWSIVIAPMSDPPSWSLADITWLCVYPPMIIGLMLIVRARVAVLGVGLLLDGLVAGLTVAACAASLAFDSIVHASQGDAIAIAVNLSYPIGDLTVLMVLAAGLAICGVRYSRTLLVLGAGLVVFAVGDTWYVWLIATDRYGSGGLVDLCWPVAFIGIMLAGQVADPVGVAPLSGRSGATLPAACASIALGLSIVFGLGRDATLGSMLALAALAAAIPRMFMAGRDSNTIAELNRQARHDELTGLANRRHFFEELGSCLTGKHMTAVLMSDLGGFKHVNDSYGHDVGDAVLKIVAQRWTGVMEEGQVLSRLGGDEFGVIATVHDRHEAIDLAERLQQALRHPVRTGNLHLNIETSIGIAFGPEHGADGDTLVANADLAMYDAKRYGPPVSVYDPTQSYSGRERLRRIHELQNAIDSDQLVMHFQPIVEAATGRISDVEALIRWNHPTRGIVAPDDFLPLVADAGLTTTITRMVLDKSLSALASWIEGGLDVAVSVNIAAADLLDDGFVEQVKALMRRYDVAGHLVTLEITEESLITNLERAIATTEALWELGVSLAIDDFGVGYSSLSQLQTLRAHKLKLDRSFVTGHTTNSRSAALVEAAVTLAHGLSMSVVAEGVEDADTWRSLGALGCEYIQGFYVSRPMPFDRLVEFASVWDEAPERARIAR